MLYTVVLYTVVLYISSCKLFFTLVSFYSLIKHLLW